MKTLGIDLAASPEKTAGCLIDWTAGGVQLLTRPLEDEAIVEAARSVDLTGIDVPFGWPDDFVAAVAAHHDGGRWPPVELDAPEDRVTLRFRRTDLVVIESGIRPLSVSTDRIGVSAMRGARILELLTRAGVAVDRSGLSGGVAEVYPAAALRAWGLQSSGYKGGRNREVCERIGTAFSAVCGAMSTAVAACILGADDDDLDAVVCAFVAKAVWDGATRRPDSIELPAARREGWIHVPTQSPEALARAIDPHSH